MDMICYDEFWLPHDMDNMAYLFEYCDEYALKLFNAKIDKASLMNAFMRSRFRAEMEIGHPKFLSQAAEDSLEQWVTVDYNGDLSTFKENGQVYAHKQMYWVGWIYAQIHYWTKKSSKEIVEKLPIEFMLEQYWTGHEMSAEAFYDRVKHRIIS